MVLERTVKVIAEHLDCDPSTITADTKFEELGIDSLEIAEIVMDIEDEFGIQIEMDSNMTAVSELVDMITKKIG